MIDLNTASPQALRALQLEPEAVAVLVRWRPFSSWDAVLQALEIDAEGLRRLQARGAVLSPDGSQTWPIPEPFQISQDHR